MTSPVTGTHFFPYHRNDPYPMNIRADFNKLKLGTLKRYIQIYDVNVRPDSTPRELGTPSCPHSLCPCDGHSLALSPAIYLLSFWVTMCLSVCGRTLMVSIHPDEWSFSILVLLALHVFLFFLFLYICFLFLHGVTRHSLSPLYISPSSRCFILNLNTLFFQWVWCV